MEIKVRKKRRRLRPEIKLAFMLIAAFLLLTFIGMGRGKKTNYYRSRGLDATKTNLVIDSTPAGECTAEYDGIRYITLSAVKQYIDPDIYYNPDEGRVIITANDKVVRLHADGCTVNGEALELNFSVYDDAGSIYLPLETVERVYGRRLSFISDKTNMLSVDGDSHDSGKTSKKTRLYAAPDKKAYYGSLPKDALVYCYGQEDGFYLAKVMSEGEMCGFVGYIPADRVEIYDFRGTDPTADDILQARQAQYPSGRVDLVFDQISNASGAAVTMSNGVPEGVNVLCPTWFSFKDEGGEVINKANADYVKWAHQNNVYVWGLVTDNFTSEISHAVLSDDKTREYAIKQIAAYADMYALDGINIDFEAVPKDDSEYWIQFLRELAPVCREHGLVLSCDLFVPKMWSLYYNRKAVGEIVDYVIVMGYDEHYRGGDEAGSVASLDWSVQAVTATLNAGVPKEKLILGVPFYTRIWTESANGGLDSAAYSMDDAHAIMQANGAEFTYDEKTGQNYAEYTDAEGRHRCWLEDEQSIKKRAALVREHDTAGIAAWKLRMEKDGIFGIISKEIK
ncbi:MAG: hypothetical protein IKS17_08580 [Firmicutes bacterium]|nr:hypothetical protein [Bacillota bacterium]